MTAQELVDLLGEVLIGMAVDTPAMGEYPGGVAMVTEIAPDPEAPEIVFQVRHPTFGEIGVFGYEMVDLA